jgi:hypothetical protein
MAEAKNDFPTTTTTATTELEMSREVSRLLNNPKPIAARIDVEWFQAELSSFDDQSKGAHLNQINLGNAASCLLLYT